MAPSSTDEPSSRHESATNALRRLMLLMDKVDDPGLLEQLAHGIQQLAAQAEASQGRRVARSINPEYGDRLTMLLPFSPITGPLNPIAPGLEYRRDGEKLVAETHFNDLYEGPPHCVHGGIIAGVFDQLLAMANMLAGTAGPTASLTVDYKKPTPLNTLLRFEAWQERVDGRKVYMKGHALHGDTVVAESSGLFIHLY